MSRPPAPPEISSCTNCEKTEEAASALTDMTIVSREPAADVRKSCTAMRISWKEVFCGYAPWYEMRRPLTGVSRISRSRMPDWNWTPSGVEMDWHCENGQP
jgi:hypothetical protein